MNVTLVPVPPRDPAQLPMPTPCYTWRIEKRDPYVAEDNSIQEGHDCTNLGELVEQVQQVLTDFVSEGWYVVPVEQWTWCCSLADESGWVMVRYVIAEAASIYPN